MQSASDEEAQTLAIYLCTEIIAGFENEDDQDFVHKSVGTTLENMR